MQLVIKSGGVVRCVYGEEIDLTALGSPVISRASHVEPDQQGRWWADMGPVRGPVLGPYELRSEALETELAWLESYWLAGGRLPAVGHEPSHLRPKKWPSATRFRANRP